MNKLTTPTRLENITPLWLTKALHSRRSQIDVYVTDISYEIIGIGKGFMNQTARLTIEYNRDSGNFPLSLIAKLSAVDPLLRQLSDLFQCGQRENRYLPKISQDLRTWQVHPHSYSAKRLKFGVSRYFSP